MHNDGHQHLGKTEYSRNLLIAESLEKTQREDLRGTRLQSGERPGQSLPQLARLVVNRFRGQLGKFHGEMGLARSKHIQGPIDRRPAQVTLLVLQRSLLFAAAEYCQKHGLGYVLGVGRVANDPVSRTEDQAVMRPKYSLEFARDCDRSFLCQYALQGTPPIAFFHN